MNSTYDQRVRQSVWALVWFLYPDDKVASSVYEEVFKRVPAYPGINSGDLQSILYADHHRASKKAPLPPVMTLLMAILDEFEASIWRHPLWNPDTPDALLVRYLTRVTYESQYRRAQRALLAVMRCLYTYSPTDLSRVTFGDVPVDHDDKYTSLLNALKDVLPPGQEIEQKPHKMLAGRPATDEELQLIEELFAQISRWRELTYRPQHPVDPSRGILDIFGGPRGRLGEDVKAMMEREEDQRHAVICCDCGGVRGLVQTYNGAISPSCRHDALDAPPSKLRIPNSICRPPDDSQPTDAYRARTQRRCTPGTLPDDLLARTDREARALAHRRAGYRGRLLVSASGTSLGSFLPDSREGFTLELAEPVDTIEVHGVDFEGLLLLAVFPAIHVLSMSTQSDGVVSRVFDVSVSVEV